MMETDKFQGATLEEAVEAVRQRWGPDAVILHVEKLTTRHGLFSTPKTSLEVTAKRPQPRKPNSDLSHSSASEAALLQELTTLRDEVLECRTTMRQMQRIQWARRRLEVKSLHPILDYMIEKGLGSDHANELFNRWTTKNSNLDLDHCIQELDACLPRLGWEDIFPSHQGRCTLFFGLPGNGKTLLLVKIAARMRLLHGGKIKLVSADLSRPGPSQELALYSEILQIPITQLFEISELQKITKETSPETHILVDWNGFSPYKPESWQPLESLHKHHPHPQIILTASLAADLRNWDRFRSDLVNLPLCGLALTQADLEHRLGKVWEASRGTNLPVAFFSTGKNVPGDFFEGRGFPFAKHFFRDYTPLNAESADTPKNQ